MTLDEFVDATAKPTPPAGLDDVLLSLWWDRKGDWEKAHEHAQAAETRDGSWVHAYLHRREGDLGNAGYWYARAGRPLSALSLDEEWTEIARELLARG